MMKIILIDRSRITRAGLSTFIKDNFKDCVTPEFGDIKSFQERSSEEKSNLIIWGITGNVSKNGLQVLRNIATHAPPILIYDNVADLNNAIMCLKGGAVGYLTKYATIDQLLESIQALLLGKKFIQGDTKNAILEKYLIERNPLGWKEYDLSPRELEVACHLAKGTRTSAIAATLKTRTSTISTFKRRIFQKLRVENIIQLEEIIGNYSEV